MEGAAARLTLPNGTAVRITLDLAEALRDAETAAAESTLLRLRRGHGSTGAAARLRQLGLAVHDPGAGHRPLRPRRRPGRVDGRRPRNGREGSGTGRPAPTAGGRNRTRGRPVGGLLAVPAPSSKGGGLVFLTAVTVWGAVVGFSWAVRNRTGWVRRPEPRPPAAAPEERRVTTDMLDAPARKLLRRTQEAVDAVLDSPLHHRGLLLDGTRNRVVLADVEWAVAGSLLRQPGVGRRIGATPTPGGWGTQSRPNRPARCWSRTWRR